MSFARLFATGKSFVETKDTTNRYRLRRQSMLPKFDSAKNPFRAQLQEVAEQCGISQPKPVEDSGGARGTPADVAAPAKRPECKPVSPRSGAKRGAQSPGRLAGLIRCLFGSKARAAKSAARQPLRIPVQGELSLDTVTVVRNDLTDADWELRPAKPAAKPRAKVQTAHSVSCETPSTWRRATRILFKANKS